jgi:hypothetical protein
LTIPFLKINFTFYFIEEQNIPTTILNNPPILTCFCAWSAAVTVNHFDKNITKQNAYDILSYIKMYMDHYYPTLTHCVRYEMDDENTCEVGLLNRITKHYNSKYDNKIEDIKGNLIKTAKSHGSNEEGSIRYASTHLIIAKDIIDKNAPLSLLHLFGGNESNDQSICLYDCIITIGGPVEERFNQLRHAIREAFIKESKENNEENFLFPLSIRILSKVGQTPVYYRHESSDITIDDVVTGRVTNLKLTDKVYEGIKVDISILRENIGIHLFKSMWDHLPNVQSNKISSWKNIVLTLADLCLKVWEEHAKGDGRKCKCLIQNRTPIEQVYDHYKLSYVHDVDRCLIIGKILDVLQVEIDSTFGQPVENLNRVWKRKINTSNQIFTELNDVLDQFLLRFVRMNFP